MWIIVGSWWREAGESSTEVERQFIHAWSTLGATRQIGLHWSDRCWTGHRETTHVS